MTVSPVCSEEDLGRFIVTTPQDVSVNTTSIFTTSVRFDIADHEDANLPSGSPGPFTYSVTRTGYYCVGVVPVTFEQPQTEIPDEATDADQIDASYGESLYTGVVDFENTFEGHLPAAEYPKIYVRPDYLKSKQR